MRKILFAVFIAAAIAGCSTTPTTETGAPIDDKSAAAAGGATTGSASGDRITGVTTGSGTGSGVPAELRDPNSILSKRSVYFDFDSFVVREEFKPLVEAHAKYLQRNRNAKMTVQGHTDERGSSAYNLDLSAKRANAVLNYMFEANPRLEQKYGSFFAASAYSKFRPLNPASTEEAYEQNRRIELSLVLKDANVRRVIDEYTQSVSSAQPGTAQQPGAAPPAPGNAPAGAAPGAAPPSTPPPP